MSSRVHLFLRSLLFLGLLSLGKAALAACPEEKSVQQAGQDLIIAARAASPSQFAQALERHGDMEALSLFALGRYRNRLPPEKRAEFVHLATRYIAVMLNDFRLKFRAQSISVVSCQDDIVKSTIFFLGTKGDQPVLWRIKNGRITDINVQNVWLAQVLRDHFLTILSANQNNMSALFEEMRTMKAP